jgi:hypothetical protein
VHRQIVERLIEGRLNDIALVSFCFFSEEAFLPRLVRVGSPILTGSILEPVTCGDTGAPICRLESGWSQVEQS